MTNAIDQIIPTKLSKKLDNAHTEFISKSMVELKNKGINILGVNAGWSSDSTGYCSKIYTNKGAVFASTNIDKKGHITNTLSEI